MDSVLQLENPSGFIAHCAVVVYLYVFLEFDDAPLNVAGHRCPNRRVGHALSSGTCVKEELSRVEAFDEA
jgi:hypothetical protein